MPAQAGIQDSTAKTPRSYGPVFFLAPSCLGGEISFYFTIAAASRQIVVSTRRS
jgi:hypothetical protein